MASTTAPTGTADHPTRFALDHRRHPHRALAAVFVAWKTCLFAIALVARVVGPAYDTSGDLLEAAASLSANASTSGHALGYALGHAPGHAIPVGGLVSRLTSWDAVYFVQSARRGYVYEQEWAFGAGLPLAVSALQAGLTRLGINLSIATVAVAYVHAAHLLSVLVLFALGRQLWVGRAGRTTAFVAAVLHVLSPAGLFLSAPYAESSCALFTFAGYAAFVAGRKQDAAAHASLSVQGDLLRLVAGAAFGLATLFRTNALLSGLVFAYEAVVGAWQLFQTPTRTSSLALVRRLASVGLGGLLVAAGSIVPQTVAYTTFCSQPSGVPGEDVRPWCLALVPSIYTYVQDRYCYWVLPNVPLFLLAAPMLFVMARSSIDIATRVSVGASSHREAKETTKTIPAADDTAGAPACDPRAVPVVQCMAATQLLLAVMAFTSYHVQIVSRLSSGYPIWYWWLAQNLAGGPRARLARGFVVFMVMYAAIQGILFASFLPPA